MTEKNSHTTDHVLFMLGMLCFLGTLTLLGLAVYLIPHVLFGWNYRLPDWIYTLQDWLQDKYTLSEGLARLSEFFVLLVVAGIMGGAAYGLSRWSAPPLIGEDPVVDATSSTANAPPKEGIWVTVKLILILGVLLVVILFFQWLFFGNATTTSG